MKGENYFMDTLKLKGLIIAAGMTQKEVAKKIGISTNTLSNKINGVREFTVGEVIQICDILDITSNAEKAEIFLA